MNQFTLSNLAKNTPDTQLRRYIFWVSTLFIYLLANHKSQTILIRTAIGGNSVAEIIPGPLTLRVHLCTQFSIESVLREDR